METMHEIIPFAKEMLQQKPSRRMVKVYLVGSVVAFFGVVLGLVETVCQPFSSDEPLDEELARLVAREQRALEAERRTKRTEGEALEREAAEPVKKQQREEAGQRNTAYRLHAS
ncbi:G0/G1 switch protein 2-like [Megalops cyprinoides]|uniref:G0/G1 switch protein 2-like n=1 Tax=Megalops cyprinoides TaxID=118141 RepID=UPI001863D6AC|nr:G0/G1 switch protein 2-like [Megalops cyprinoides]XP_036388000.1 G0/G1 switch protein 2-like [Megalops cyprinoides]